MADAAETEKAELTRLAREAGEQAVALFRQFTKEQITPAELRVRLCGLEVNAIMARHWDLLTAERDTTPCFELLQLLSSLAAEMDHQIERYGENSLWDDLRELQGAVRRIDRREASN